MNTVVEVSTMSSMYPIVPLYSDNVSCNYTCSVHGECLNGRCYCEIQFEGDDCRDINVNYHIGFSSVFFLLALISLIQLIACVHAEFVRSLKKRPSILRACRVTTQKFLYFLVFVLSSLRGMYFAVPKLTSQWSLTLLSPFYPLILTGSSLIVCFWAEVFHLNEVHWERPRFLSKSLSGFFAFNAVSYSLLMAELTMVWLSGVGREFYANWFNGCYAFLMFIVVIFFLVYGVEVFFKVRGGFTISVPSVPVVIMDNSNQILDKDHRTETKASVAKEIKEVQKEVFDNDCGSESEMLTVINPSQLHQSRFGLLSQAIMMIIIVGFLLADTVKEFWQTKLNLPGRNAHFVIFHTMEIGIALWFPCVLWNCIRPDKLWILNPKRLLERLGKSNKMEEGDLVAIEDYDEPEEGEEEDTEQECWICYDGSRTDVGSLIQPCNCRGDTATVHHGCLHRWLIESANNPDSLKCKVCDCNYVVEWDRIDRRGLSFSLDMTVRQWIVTVSLVGFMCSSIGACWAVIHLNVDSYVRVIAVGVVILIQYVCFRSLGLTTVTAIQRAKVSALKIVNLHNYHTSSLTTDVSQ